MRAATFALLTLASLTISACVSSQAANEPSGFDRLDAARVGLVGSPNASAAGDQTRFYRRSHEVSTATAGSLPSVSTSSRRARLGKGRASEEIAARTAASLRPHAVGGKNPVAVQVGDITGALWMVEVDGYKFGVVQVVKTPILFSSVTSAEIEEGFTRAIATNTVCAREKQWVQRDGHSRFKSLVAKLRC